jgi:hypothetical protein
MNFRDVRTAAVDALPSFLRPLAEQAAEKERTDNEQRRSVLAKEVQAFNAAYGKTSRVLIDAAERARSKRDAAKAEYFAAQSAFDAAVHARDGASLGKDSYVNARLSEIRALADPRIVACRDELSALADAMRKNRPETHIVATREMPARGRNSIAVFQEVTRIRTNSRSFLRRASAITDAIQELDLLACSTDVDVAKAVAKVRASIPELGDLETVDVKDGSAWALVGAGDVEGDGAATTPYVAQDVPALGASALRT